jgi:hypothetical protein
VRTGGGAATSGMAGPLKATAVPAPGRILGECLIIHDLRYMSSTKCRQSARHDFRLLPRAQGLVFRDVRKSKGEACAFKDLAANVCSKAQLRRMPIIHDSRRL